jgi:regulatory protein
MTIDRPAGPSRDRSATLAQLAAQMQRITDEPSPARPAERRTVKAASVASTTARPGAGRTGRTQVGSGDRPPASAAPGHPEDELGDPEAVARAICLRLLATAARPRAGLATALARKGIPPEVAERVLDRLTEVGLVDDEAYAQSFVASRHRHGALGADALRDELRRKGVDPETATSAVAVVDRDAEYERARAFLERRVDSAMIHGTDTARRRLLGLLARRGYPADLAQRVVREVMAAYATEADGAAYAAEAEDRE